MLDTKEKGLAVTRAPSKSHSPSERPATYRSPDSPASEKLTAPDDTLRSLRRLVLLARQLQLVELPFHGLESPELDEIIAAMASLLSIWEGRGGEPPPRHSRIEGTPLYRAERDRRERNAR